MKPDLYRYLMAVEKTRNITKAAEMLHISQPALTKAILKHERELGVKLFDRESSPLILTYAGERYLQGIRKLLDIEQALHDEMGSIARGIKERVRIGVTVERGTSWLPKILPAFAILHPDVDVQVTEGINAALEEALLNNELDFCISTLPTVSKEIEYEVQDGSPVYLISSDKHSLARSVNLEVNSPLRPQYILPKQIEGERFLTLTPGQGMYFVAYHILNKYALRVDVVMRLTSQRTITLLAAAGLGLAFTTYNGTLQAINEPGIHPVFYTLDDPMYLRRNIITYKKNRAFSPAVMNLIALSRRVMLNSPMPLVEIQH